MLVDKNQYNNTTMRYFLNYFIVLRINYFFTNFSEIMRLASF